LINNQIFKVLLNKIGYAHKIIDSNGVFFYICTHKLHMGQSYFAHLFVKAYQFHTAECGCILVPFCGMFSAQLCTLSSR